MQWKRKFLPTGPSLIGGENQYKVVKYGKKWFSFFKPDGWVNFGNSCRHRFGKSCEYDGIREAIADAEAHYSEFGDKPFSGSR